MSMARRFRALLAGLLCLGLAAAQAGIRDDAPPRGEPFEGLFDKAKMKPAPEGLPKSLLDKRLAILLSAGTERHLKWSAEMTGGLGSVDRAFMGAFGGQKALQENDRLHKEVFAPEVIVNSVVDPLVAKAAEVKVIGKLADFQAGGFDYLVLMDITFHHRFFDSPIFIGNKYEAGAFISAFFIDRAGELAGRVEAGESKPVERNRFLYDEADIRKRVTTQFVRALTQQFGPDRPPPAPALAAAPQAPKPAAERLKELDALLKQGLITAEEAEHKRKKILEEL